MVYTKYSYKIYNPSNLASTREDFEEEKRDEKFAFNLIFFRYFFLL